MGRNRYFKARYELPSATPVPLQYAIKKRPLSAGPTLTDQRNCRKVRDGRFRDDISTTSWNHLNAAESRGLLTYDALTEKWSCTSAGIALAGQADLPCR